MRIELEKARDLCRGLARSKIEEEIELTRDIVLDEQARRPHVSYRLDRADESVGDGRLARYAYELTIRPPGIEPFTRLVTVSVRDEEGVWRVANFNEAESLESRLDRTR